MEEDMEKTVLLQDSHRENGHRKRWPDIQSHNEKRLYCHLQYILIIAGTISLVLVPIITLSISKPSPPTPLTDLGRCGTTPDEARANGCVFDLMMTAWLHPQCYDKELSDQYLRENNWTFYREREAINVISEKEARLGNYYAIYTHGSFHYQHCAYIWVKQLRARAKSPYVLDSDSRSEWHSQHCVDLVGFPNTTKFWEPTGTTLGRSNWRIRCMTGEGYVE